MRLEVLSHLDDFVRLGPLRIVGTELVVLKYLFAHLCLGLRRLVVWQSGMGVDDVAGCRHIGILPVVGGIQSLHGGVALCLHPHLVLLLAALVYGCALLQEAGVVGYERLHEVVNLLCRAVVMRVGQSSQPRCVQLFIVSHKYFFKIKWLIIITECQIDIVLGLCNDDRTKNRRRSGSCNGDRTLKRCRSRSCIDDRTFNRPRSRSCNDAAASGGGRTPIECL